MGSKSNFFSFFTGDKDKEEDLRAMSKTRPYLDHLLSDENLQETLNIVNRIVSMEDWLFQPSENGFQYHNKSMEAAIEVGKEAQSAVSYLSGNEDYYGVQLNQDVLKTVLVHFMNTIDAYEFEAARGDLPAIYEQALNTPEEMIKYILEERKSKLDILSKDPEASGSNNFACRIFEYDLILQVAGAKTPSDSAYLEEMAEAFAQALDDKFSLLGEMEGGAPRDGDVSNEVSGEEVEGGE